jgi:hypothetical protein
MELQSARREAEKHEQRARDVSEGLPALEDRLNKAKAQAG